MAERELSLTISMSALSDHLNCPVCMKRLTNTHITPCGHRYCDVCIQECVNRYHKCPCCNAPLHVDQLIKDPQFDTLLEQITREETEAEKKYFDHLIGSAYHGSGSQQANGEASNLRSLFSPVEEVLKDHLKKSLMSHEKFYQDLQRDLFRRRAEIDAEMKQSIDTLQSGTLSLDEILKSTQRLTDESNRQKAALDDEMQRCANLVAQAYDRYLTEHIPDLAILPVTVSISMLSKSIQIHDVHLKPQDTMDDLKRIICEQMSALGDQVMSFEPDVKFLCFAPFVKRSLYEMLHAAGDIVNNGATNSDIVLLPSVCRPVIQFAIRPGSEIAVYGTVKCESDIPKQCFTVSFRAEDRKAMDYFNCKNCKMNWVCRPCMSVCHKDHEVVPYIMNHQPTWACCYCPKKKKCSIAT